VVPAAAVRCNRKVGTRCQIRLTGLLKKRGPKVTEATNTSLKAGRKKRVALNVKSRYAGKLDGRKKIWVKQRVRANGKTRSSVKKLKLKS
jgi:hypothetical protein